MSSPQRNEVTTGQSWGLGRQRTIARDASFRWHDENMFMVTVDSIHILDLRDFARHALCQRRCNKLIQIAV